MHFWQNFFKQKQETARQNILKPLWSHFWPKLVAVRPPKILGQRIFLMAPFDLLRRTFGHLATVARRSTQAVGISGLYNWTIIDSLSSDNKKKKHEPDDVEI